MIHRPSVVDLSEPISEGGPDMEEIAFLCADGIFLVQVEKSEVCIEPKSHMVELVHYTRLNAYVKSLDLVFSIQHSRPFSKVFPKERTVVKFMVKPVLIIVYCEIQRWANADNEILL